jgi:hypothetical protein
MTESDHQRVEAAELAELVFEMLFCLRGDIPALPLSLESRDELACY